MTPGALLFVSESRVTRWALSNVRTVRVTLHKGGATLWLDDASVGLGLALAGGLTWMDAGALQQDVMRAVGQPSVHPELTPSPRNLSRTAALAAGTLAACVIAVFAWSHVRQAQVLELLQAEAARARAERAADASDAVPPPSKPTPAASAKTATAPEHTVAKAPTPAVKPAAKVVAPKPAATSGSASVRLLSPTVKGASLPPEVARRVVARSTPAVSACVRAAAHPGLEGSLHLRLSLARSGQVTAVAPAPDSTVLDPKVRECAAKTLAKLVFPESDAPGVVDVPYQLSAK